MSTVKHLFKIALDLRIECQKHEVFLYLLHISGDRMIATGIDARSRGNLDAGVSLGHDLCQYIPLNKGAFVQEGLLLERLFKDLMGEDYAAPLEPIGWFGVGHQPGVHIWAPPPAAALIALKQLARSRQKRPHKVTHVFICQRLLWQEEWRRRMEKEMDLWFMLYPGTFWPHHNFEPLVIGFSFPMLNREGGPWLVRQK